MRKVSGEIKVVKNEIKKIIRDHESKEPPSLHIPSIVTSMKDALRFLPSFLPFLPFPSLLNHLSYLQFS